MGTITHSCDHELDIATYLLEGDVSYQQIRDAIDQYYHGALTRYTLWDFTKTPLQYTSEEIYQIAATVRAYSAGAVRQGGADILVVDQIAGYGKARIYAGYAEAQGNTSGAIQTKIFRTTADAMAWIRKDSAEHPQQKDTPAT